MKETLNLLPLEGTAGVSRKRHALLYTIVAAGIYTSIIVVLWLSHVLQEKNIRQEMKTLRQQRGALQARLSEMQSVSLQALPVEREILRSLEASPRWSGVLRELSVVTPQGVWLTSFETRLDDGIANLKGHALSQMDVASFVADLEKSRFFGDISIAHLQKGDQDIAFEIRGKIRWH